MNGKSTFYTKTYLSHDQFKSFQVTYPTELASTFNPITASVSEKNDYTLVHCSASV